MTTGTESGARVGLRRSLVRDVMSTAVVSVEPETTIDEVIRTLTGHAVRAVPVVRGSRLLGVVSEADLMRGAEHTDVTGRRHDRAADRPTTAGAAMSYPPITIRPDATVAEAARRMRRRHLGWLPVTEFRDGVEHLVGVLGRRDVLSVFLRDDAEIRAEIVEVVLPHLAGADAARVRVAVEDGVVTLDGQVSRRGQAVAVVALISRLEGVVGVRDELTFDRDERVTDSIAGPFY
ncbi:CBS domain-containing protein [Pseudonocardia xishanensis]|uniref:CBS domain-containing protein n=1 Tax=Pseudonocardia xishanensis TaxID=630995 RepID=A0ABP8RU54_9PSEU